MFVNLRSLLLAGLLALPMASAAQAQTLYEDGYYRVDGNDVVYRLFTRNGQKLNCGIASGEHLANLGGEGRISVLSVTTGELGSRRTWVETCEVVDGFYRVNEAGVVWWLYSERSANGNRRLYACGVGSGRQLADLGGATKVFNLPQGAEAGAQREWTGTCPDSIG